MTLRIVVADDQALVRAGFRVLIAAEAGLSVVGEAATGTEAVELARRVRPDIVLMDIRMPGMDGIEATRAIVGAAGTAAVRILILTTFDIDDYVFAALRAGASGFLLKDTRPDDLLDAIRVIAAGEALLAPRVTRRLIEEFARQPEPPRPAQRPAETLQVITDREREILTQVGRGLSNAEIARELHISPHTAKTHVGRLLYKLDVRDRVQLVILAYQAGLVSAG
jgi:DNA-binding NarL/FixJ family response regulator